MLDKEKIEKALRSAPRLAESRLIVNEECCAVGQLLRCAGYSDEELALLRVDLSMTFGRSKEDVAHEVLRQEYGLNPGQVESIMEINDEHPEQERVSAVLWYLENEK
jgi:hypothetical protein